MCRFWSTSAWYIGRILYSCPPKGRWWIYIQRRKASWYINLALWTDIEGDSWFSIYQISWIKIKKKLFVNKGFTFLEFVTFQLTVFRASFFMISLQIQKERFFLPTSKHQQAKFCLFIGICWHSCFIYR